MRNSDRTAALLYLIAKRHEGRRSKQCNIPASPRLCGTRNLQLTPTADILALKGGGQIKFSRVVNFTSSEFSFA